MAKKKKLTEEMFKDLQQDLKELNMQWVALLVTQIQNSKTIDDIYKEVNERKIYNVFNGGVKDGAWKLLVYTQACKLKEKLERKLEEALK